MPDAKGQHPWRALVATSYSRPMLIKTAIPSADSWVTRRFLDAGAPDQATFYDEVAKLSTTSNGQP